MVSIHKKGFTLIEILIATTIFAMIMVITASTFSWAVAYNGKLKEMRATSRDGMKIADDLSSEIRFANGSPLSAKYGNNWYQNYSNGDIRSGEIVLLNCSVLAKRSCRLPTKVDSKTLTVSMKKPVYFSDANANALLIYQKSKGKVILYQSLKDVGLPYKEGSTDDEDLYNYSMYKRVANFDTWPAEFDLGSKTGWSKPDKLNDSGVSVKVDFGGFGPVSKNRIQQPFVEFFLSAKTIDFENTQSNFRDNFELQTFVETREYNKP